MCTVVKIRVMRIINFDRHRRGHRYCFTPVSYGKMYSLVRSIYKTINVHPAEESYFSPHLRWYCRGSNVGVVHGVTPAVVINIGTRNYNFVDELSTKITNN